MQCVSGLFGTDRSRITRTLLSAVCDAAVVVISCYLALFVRYSGAQVPDRLADSCPYLAASTALVSLVLFRALRIHRIHSKYMGFVDAVAICATALIVTIFLACMVHALGLYEYPRGAYVIFWLLVTFLMIGGRSVSRLVRVARRALQRSGNKHKRVLILGAGQTGEWALKQIQNGNSNTHVVVGFLDDDPCKQGIDIRRVPVLGDCSKLKEVVNRKRVNEVLLAMPSASGAKVREILKACAELKVVPRVMPGLDCLNDRPGAEYSRPMQAEDLLTRPEVKIDLDAVANYLQGKRVLITGAGGSIGSELARQVHAIRPSQLILLGRGENSIFTVDEELRNVCHADPIPVIADVTDAERLRRVFAQYRPEVVFHAAAHKHVPLMEIQPEEAVKCNIIGTKNVVELSEEFSVERFVLISTDKAVKPTSVMGATKRVAEMILQQAASRNGRTKFMAVRFGNVLGSRGSVVPTMQKQIERGGPVTVTHPEMMRYFMTTREAVSLVIQAGCMGEGGEVFVLDMGEPMNVMELAEALIRMSGKVPHEDIPIEICGIRPGEKLREEPLTSHEGTKATKHDRIFIAPLEHMIPDDLDRKLAHLALMAAAGDAEGIRSTLASLIPTYQPWTPPQVPTDDQADPDSLEGGVS
ncbi:MAG: polysaccharide biosynthesis protein [Armatimonadota bacterium]